MARTGRRPGGVDTRAAILAAARLQFAELGYTAVSMRGVARAAGVDPALVHHYFEGKSGLFAEAMALPLDPADVLPAVLGGPTDQLGERIVGFFLTAWESPQTGPQLAAAMRTMLSSDRGSVQLGEFVLQEILGRVVSGLDIDQPMLRATMVGSQLVGLAVVRYLIRLEPITSASHEQVIASLAPVLQNYLTGPLPVLPPRD